MSGSGTNSAVVPSERSGNFTLVVGSEDYYSYLNGAITASSGTNTLLLEIGDVAKHAIGEASHVIFKVKWDKADHPRDWKGRFKDVSDHIAAGDAGLGDVVISKSGKVFQIEKQTEKGVKVNPVDPKTGEVKDSYTVLGNTTEVALLDAAKEPGTIHPIKSLDPGTLVEHPNSGKLFKISKHGKWTTVYPVDAQGNTTGKHTVLKPETKVMVTKPGTTADVTPEQVKQIEELKVEPKPEPPGEMLLQRVKEWMDAEGKDKNYQSTVLDNYLTDEYIKVSGAAKGQNQSGGIKDLTVDEIAYALYHADWWEGDHPGMEEPPDPTEQQLTATRVAHKKLFSKLYGVQGGYATKLKNWEAKNPQPPEVLLRQREVEAVQTLIEERVSSHFDTGGPEDVNIEIGIEGGPDYDHLIDTDSADVISAWLQNYEWDTPGLPNSIDTDQLADEILLARDKARMDLKKEWLAKAKGGGQVAEYQPPAVPKGPSNTTLTQQTIQGYMGNDVSLEWAHEVNDDIATTGSKDLTPLTAVEKPMAEQSMWGLLDKHGIKLDEDTKKLLLEDLAAIAEDGLTEQKLNDRLQKAAQDGDVDALERELYLQRYAFQAWHRVVELNASLQGRPDKRHAFLLAMLQGPPGKDLGPGHMQSRLSLARSVAGGLTQTTQKLDADVLHKLDTIDDANWDEQFALSLPALGAYAPGGSEQIQLPTDLPDEPGTLGEAVKILKAPAPTDMEGLRRWWAAADRVRAVDYNANGGIYDHLFGSAARRFLERRQQYERLMRTRRLVAATKAAKAKAVPVPDMGDVDEQLPQKLPKPPKKYPPGVGKDTVVIVEYIGDTTNDILKGAASPDDPVQPGYSTKARVKRVPADNLDAPGELIDYTSGVGTAIRMARKRSGPHERIIRRDFKNAIDAPDEISAEHLDIQARRVFNGEVKAEDIGGWESTMADSEGEEFKVVNFLAASRSGAITKRQFRQGETKEYDVHTKEWVTKQGVHNRQFNAAFEDDDKSGTSYWSQNYSAYFTVKVDPNDPKVQQAIGEAKQENESKTGPAYMKTVPNLGGDWVKENLLPYVRREEKEIRKAHPEKYVPELRSEWDMGEVSGLPTNEAIKKLGKLGFREIRPRKEGNPKLINALGRRVLLTVEDGKVTNVESLKPVYSGESETTDELSKKLNEAMGKGMSVLPLDPRNDPDPAARNSISKLLTFDMALGKQNGVALHEPVDQPAGPKVKTDAQYRDEIEAEGVIKPLAEYEQGIPLEALRVKARGTIIERFGMNDDPNWDFPTRQLVIPNSTNSGIPDGLDAPATSFPDGWFVDQKAATTVIAERTGVADAMLGESHLSDVEPTFSEKLKIKEGQSIYEAGAKLAHEYGLHKKGEASALDDLDPKTRDFVVSQLDAKLGGNALSAMEAQRKAQRAEKAKSLRDADMKAEIDKRRAAEGTVATAPSPDNNDLNATPAEFHIPTWDTIELQPQTVEDINDQVAKIEGPYDVPVFFTGGMLQDGVMQFGNKEAWARVEVGFDQVIRDRLAQMGADEAENSQNLEDILGSYTGSGKIYPGEMMLLEEATKTKLQGKPLKDALTIEAKTWLGENSPMTELGMIDTDALDKRLKAIDEVAAKAPDDVTADDFFAMLENKDGVILAVNNGENLHSRLTQLEQKGPTAKQTNRMIKDELKRVLDEYDYPDDVAAKWKYFIDNAPEDAIKGSEVLSYVMTQIEKDAGPAGPKRKKMLSEMKVRAGQVEAKGGGLHRVEYVPHEQSGDLKPDSHGLTTGAPTSQRGQLRFYGFTPEETIEFMKELGIVYDLEPEVPFESILRSKRRHGRVNPMLPAYIRGEAPPPKIKLAVTHGVTGGFDDLKAILKAGAALNIAERVRVHTQGKASTSKKGDVRSGIDHGLFCSVGKGGWGTIKLVMSDDVYLRRDLCLAPQDYGGMGSRYSHYANHHNKLRHEAGEQSANLYEPLSPEARQQHISHHAGGHGNEFNQVNGVTLEDITHIVVPTATQRQEAEAILQQLVMDGAISKAPQVVEAMPNLKRKTT